MAAKILLIEDDPTSRSLYEERFKLEGYEVASAGDGEEGMLKAEAELPEMILLDLHLPKASGFEVLHFLKNNLKTRAIPVFILTALSGADKKRCLEMGAKGFFDKSKTKPLELVEKVNELLIK